MGGLSDSNAPAIEKADRFYSLLFVAFSTLLLVLVGHFLHLTYRQTERAIEVASLNEAHILSARTDTILRQTSMAAAVGISPSSVGRIWREAGLKPHRIETL